MPKLKVTGIIELDKMSANKDGEIESLQTAIEQAIKDGQIPEISQSFISTGCTFNLKHAVRIEMLSKNNADRSNFFQQCKKLIHFIQDKIKTSSTVSMIQD